MLHRLLVSLFDAEEFRRWIAYTSAISEIKSKLPTGTPSMDDLVSSAIQALSTSGLINEALFQQLATVRPHRLEEIRHVATHVLPWTPRVFISYTHDNEAHRGRVLILARALRRSGIDAWIDRFDHTDNWAEWSVTQLRSAQFILVACSPIYRRASDVASLSAAHAALPAQSRGAAWQAILLRMIVHEGTKTRPTVIPILFPGQSAGLIPAFLADRRCYQLDTEFGALRGRLLGMRDVDPSKVSLPRTSELSEGSRHASLEHVLAELKIIDSAMGTSSTPSEPAARRGTDPTVPTTPSSPPQPTTAQHGLPSQPQQNQIQNKRLGSAAVLLIAASTGAFLTQALLTPSPPLSGPAISTSPISTQGPHASTSEGTIPDTTADTSSGVSMGPNTSTGEGTARSTDTSTTLAPDEDTNGTVADGTDSRPTRPNSRKLATGRTEQGCGATINGDAAVGIKILLRQLDRNRADFDVYFCLAEGYRRLGNSGSALAFFERALSIRPKSKIALVGAARSAARLKRTNKALGLYERILAIDPTSEEARTYLADHRRSEGSVLQAATATEGTLEIDFLIVPHTTSQ